MVVLAHIPVPLFFAWEGERPLPITNCEQAIVNDGRFSLPRFFISGVNKAAALGEGGKAGWVGFQFVPAQVEFAQVGEVMEGEGNGR